MIISYIDQKTDNRSQVVSFLRDHLRKSWGIYVGVLGVVYLFYKVGGPLGDFLVDWVIGHVTVQEGVASVDKWGKGLLASGVLMLVALLIVAIVSSSALYKTRRATAGAEKIPILIKTFRRTTEAADLISKKLFPGAALPVKLVLACKQVYTIYEGGDCHYSEELTVAAKAKDTHFMEKIIDVEPEADPAEYPDEIDLKVKSKTPGKEVQYLISKNEPRSKSFVIFFLPRIQAGEADKRELKISYYWKGHMKRLVLLGSEPFNMRVKSVEPVPSIEYQFWMKPSQRKLVCVHVGEPLDEGKETLEERPADERGMTGWVYTARDVPPGHTTRLRLERRIVRLRCRLASSRGTCLPPT